MDPITLSMRPSHQPISLSGVDQVSRTLNFNLLPSLIDYAMQTRPPSAPNLYEGMPSAETDQLFPGVSAHAYAASHPERVSWPHPRPLFSQLEHYTASTAIQAPSQFAEQQQETTHQTSEGRWPM